MESKILKGADSLSDHRLAGCINVQRDQPTCVESGQQNGLCLHILNAYM